MPQEFLTGFCERMSTQLAVRAKLDGRLDLARQPWSWDRRQAGRRECMGQGVNNCGVNTCLNMYCLAMGLPVPDQSNWDEHDPKAQRMRCMAFAFGLDVRLWPE